MVPTKESSPHLPVTPEEIAADVQACRRHGITSVHLHARDRQGAPSASKEIYARIVAGIRERDPELVICVSCSGRNAPEFAQRSAVLELDGDLKPDMASLTLGSLNFTRSASVNSPDMIRDLAAKMRDRGIKPELEVFDVGMVNYAGYLIDKGLLTPPHYFNILLGNIASAQASLLHLATIVAALPPRSIWCLAGFGADQLTMNAVAIAMGAGVRVGLEDNLWLDRGRTRPADNPSLVKRLVELAAIHERRTMTPIELRRALEIP
jgi:uncharacterized protein (DUF849 family)